MSHASAEPASGRAARAASGISRIIGSRWALVVIIAAFVVSALAIALTTMPGFIYDESYHFGIIQAYSHQYGPFIRHQSTATDQLGDLTRFGSFLYHWLLSYPYRWAHAAGWSTDAEYRLLRTITVAFSAASLPFFRRMLVDSGASKAVANTAILAYTALPIVPYLAATINYDNLMLLFAAVHLSLGVRLYVDHRRSVAFWSTFFLMGGLASLTKFEYLPVFAFATVVVILRYVVLAKRMRAGWVPSWRTTTVRFGSAWTIASLVFLVMAAGLFIDRYLGNLMAYHSLTPDCAVIHSPSFCSAYGVWERNAQLLAQHPHVTALTVPLLVFFTSHSWTLTILHTFDWVGGAGQLSDGTAVTFWLIAAGAAVGGVIVLLTLGRLLRRPGMQLLAIVGVGYGLVLLHQNLSDYLKLGQPLGIQGRYTLIFAPALLGAVGLGLQIILDRLYPRAAGWLKIAVFVVLFLCLLQGGWFTTFMFRAQPGWLDPSSPFFGLAHWFTGLAHHLDHN